MAHLKPVPEPKPEPAAGGQPSIEELERYATVLRLHCVNMLAVAKSGHLDSSLSSADIVAALYFRVLRHDPRNSSWPERDRFVLSKGHAAPIQYAALAEHGYFPAEDLQGLRQIGSHLQGHPDMHRTNGVEVSTGSLGQGLSMSVGICLALRLDGLADTSHVFTLMSDGDCQEGQSWEAAMSAPHYGIQNLTAIVDYNHLQTDGTTEEVMDTATSAPSSRPSAGTPSRSTATTWAPSSSRSSAAARSTARLRSSARQEGARRLLHGGALRLPCKLLTPSRPEAGTSRRDSKAQNDARTGPAPDGRRGGGGEDRADRDAPGLRRRARCAGEAHDNVVALDADLADRPSR